MSTGWGVVIEHLTHDDEEQRRHRRHREMRRQTAEASPPRRVWVRRSAARVVCARAAATVGSLS
jgi:hypothetical protein